MSSRTPPDTARRLRRLQEALEGADHGAATRMARRLEISPQRWHNVIRGLPLGAALTDRLVDRIPGLSSDWLRYGRPEGLSLQMAQLLGEAGRGSPRLESEK